MQAHDVSQLSVFLGPDTDVCYHLAFNICYHLAFKSFILGRASTGPATAQSNEVAQQISHNVWELKHSGRFPSASKSPTEMSPSVHPD